MNIASYQQAQEYQRTEVETANPAHLVVMLYDGAIRFLAQARALDSTGTVEARHICLIKAQRIIAELLASLDHEKGGAVAANLQNLYAYMLQQLVEANLYGDSGRIDAVADLLRQLRASWAEIERGQIGPSRSGEPGPSGQPRRVAIGG